MSYSPNAASVHGLPRFPEGSAEDLAQSSHNRRWGHDYGRASLSERYVPGALLVGGCDTSKVWLLLHGELSVAADALEA